MEQYIKRPNTVNISSIINKDNIMAPSRYKIISIKNNNVKPLSEVIDIAEDTVSIERVPKYYQYIEIGDINNITGMVSNNKLKSIDIPAESANNIKYEDILISTVRTYLGGIGIITEDINDLIASKALIVLRDILIPEVSRYYIFGILRSSFFIQQTDIILNAGVYPRLERKHFGSLVIPFPTKKNFVEPKKIENFMSLIVKNIIDKEKEIKRKNKYIDDYILNEITNNQAEKTYQYKYPSITKIKGEGRMNTIIYSDKYMHLEFLVNNYSNGVFFINEKRISPGKTPKDYYYTNKKLLNTFLWVTPKNLQERQLLFRTYLHTKRGTNVKKYSLIFSGIRYVGNGIFVDDDSEKIYCNQNTLVITHSNDKDLQIFLLCYLSSEIGKKMQMDRRIVGTVPILYSADLAKIPIPNFNKEKMKVVVKEYYNEVKKNYDLNYDNYLQKEKDRNKLLGIYQLNKEIFELQDLLEDLTHKIVMNEKIDISFKY